VRARGAIERMLRVKVWRIVKERQCANES